MEEKGNERATMTGHRSSRTKHVLLEGLLSPQLASADQLHADFGTEPSSEFEMAPAQRELEQPSPWANFDLAKRATALGRAYELILSWKDQDKARATKNDDC